jgi:hypothetical protein
MNIRAVCPQVTWESLSEMSGMQRISNKMLPLVDIRSKAGLSPWLVTPPLLLAGRHGHGKRFLLGGTWSCMTRG